MGARIDHISECHISLQSPVTLLNSRTNALKEVILIKWLGQIKKHTGFQRLRVITLVGMSRDKNGWNMLPCGVQFEVEFEPRHTRHLHVGDQEICVDAPTRLQQAHARIERLNKVTV